MNRTFTHITSLILAIVLSAVTAQAGNVLGGTMDYRYIGGTSYEVTVDLYIDCSSGLNPSSLQLSVIRSGGCGNGVYSMNPKGTTEITNVCPTATTECQGGTNFGVRKHTLMDTIDVQVSCGEVELIVNYCCRTETLTNQDGSAGVYDLYLTTKLSSGALNTSPAFNATPTILVPNNAPVELDFSATGRNGDSLVYAMEAPFYDAGTTLDYLPGFSLSNPFTTNGSYFFNTETGLLSFYPTQEQVVALSIRVYQYRNGNLVGTAHRDALVVVSDSLTTNNTPTLSGLNNTTQLAAAYNGGDTVRFSIYTDDADLTQQLEVAVLQNLPGATVDTVPGLRPQLDVEWITTLSDISSTPYQFTVQVKDNGCPYIQKSTKTYFIYITNQLSEVWPGDANNDLIVDMQDLLPIGLAFGNTGPTRPSASSSWMAQTAPDWAVSFINGLDYKFADCDGNGLIDSFDTQAILSNYNLGHFKTSNKQQNSQTGPPLFMNPSVDTIMAGSTLQIPVFLGSPTNVAGDVYGVTFSILYNSDYVVPGSASVTFDTCWLNDGAGIITLFKELPAENRIDVGLTRINQVAINGNGELAVVSVVMQDDITGKTDIFAEVEFDFDNIKMIDANGFELPVNKQDTTIIIQDPVAVEEINAQSPVQVYPNPANSKLFIESSLDIEQITLYNSTGKIVHTQAGQQVYASAIDVSHLPAGVYLINIKDKQGHTYMQRVVMQTSR